MHPDAQQRRPFAAAEAWLNTLFERKSVLVLLCLVAAGITSWWLGQDANWDLRNYHIYNPYALLEGRWNRDFVPASVQTFFNPLADIPYYLLSTKIIPGYPRIVAAVQGLYYGALIFFVLYSNSKAWAGRSDVPLITGGLATVIGVTGAMTLSEVGSTFNDMQAAACMFGGIAVAVGGYAGQGPISLSSRRAFWAGAIFGIAAGVKLLYGFYAPAFCLAILAAEGSIARSIRPIFWFSAGFAAVVLLTAGWWCFEVYLITGSPVFPIFNEVFRSDWYPASDYAHGGLFHIHSVFQAIAFPFWWTRYNYLVVTEVGFRDVRFAAALTFGILLLCAGAAARFCPPVLRQSVRHVLPTSSSMRFMVAFMLAAYLTWILMFRALRFAIAIEVLTGTIIMLGLELVAAAVFARGWRAAGAAILAMLLVAALVSHTTIVQWERVPYGPKTFNIEMPDIPEHSMVALAGVPLSFVTPFVGAKDFVAVGISAATGEARGYQLFSRTRQKLAAHQGPVFVVTNAQSASMRPLAAELGLVWRDETCKELRSNIESGLALCKGEIRP